MSRVKEYLALIPIVGTKYVYQRGVNGSFKFSSENLNLSEPSSGMNEKQTTIKTEYQKKPSYALIQITRMKMHQR